MMFINAFYFGGSTKMVPIHTSQGGGSSFVASEYLCLGLV